MLDYNRRPSFADRVTAAVDRALTADQATRPARDYLGGSRLGHGCERALQFEFAGAPKDEGQDFSGRSLRIFAIGHELEDLAIRWLRAAGLDLVSQKRDGGQFGFSVAGGRIRGHVDGIVAAGPEGFGLAVPALWECKTMNAKNWRACVKDGVTKYRRRQWEKAIDAFKEADNPLRIEIAGIRLRHVPGQVVHDDGSVGFDFMGAFQVQDRLFGISFDFDEIRSIVESLTLEGKDIYFA